MGTGSGGTGRERRCRGVRWGGRIRRWDGGWRARGDRRADRRGGANDRAARRPIGVSDSRRCTGLTVSAGDMVVIRTGRWARRAEVGPWDVANAAAGLYASVIPWLREQDIAILGGEAARDMMPADADSAVTAADDPGPRPLHRVGRVHRRLGGGRGGGRRAAARDPRRRLVAGAVLLLRAAVVLPPADYTDGRGRRDHAARRQRVPHHHGHAGRGAPGVDPGVDPALPGGPLVALAAFATIIAVSPYARGAAPPVAPLFGIVARTAAALPAGLLDGRRCSTRPGSACLGAAGRVRTSRSTGGSSTSASRSSSSQSSGPSRPTATPSRYSGFRTASRCRSTSRSSSGR